MWPRDLHPEVPDGEGEAIAHNSRVAEEWGLIFRWVLRGFIGSTPTPGRTAKKDLKNAVNIGFKNIADSIDNDPVWRENVIRYRGWK